MQIGMSAGARKPRQLAPVQRAIGLLKKFGSDAHLYVPGVGSVNGIQPYNYASNTGAANPDAVVDNTVGLMLDNGQTGSVTGAELSSYANTTTVTAISINSTFSTALVVGNTYEVSYTARTTGSVQLGVLNTAYGWQTSNPATVSSATDVSGSFRFQASDTVGRAAIYPISGTATVTSLSVRPYYGTSAATGAPAGQIGSELSPGFGSSAGWTLGTGMTITGGKMNLAATPNNANSGYSVAVTSGKWYQVSITVDSYTSGGPVALLLSGGAGVTAPSAGTYTAIVQATGSGSLYVWQTGASATTAVVSAVSVKECYGIPASQATAGSRPTLRRGAVNLLKYSNDLTNAAYTLISSATRTTNTVTFAIGSTSGVENLTAISGGTASKSFTVAALVSCASGTVPFRLKNTQGGVLDNFVELVATTTPTLYVLAVTNGATAGTGSQLFGVVNSATSPAINTLTVNGCGLFLGTLTAAQILANGGIPLTTTAAASQSAGSWWGEYTSSSSQQLALASVPFQMADDHCVIAVAMTKSSANHTVFEVGPGTNTTPRVCSVRNNSGSVNATWHDGTLASNSFTSTVAVGTPYIVSARKVGNTVVCRLNGVAGASVTQSLSSTTSTSAVIGNRNAAVAGEYMNGSIGQVIVIKGTVSDNDLLTIERALGQQYGITVA